MPQDKIDLLTDIAKVFGFHVFAITISLSTVEWTLKIVSLLAAIGYTLWKWRSDYLKDKK